MPLVLRLEAPTSTWASRSCARGVNVIAADDLADGAEKDRRRGAGGVRRALPALSAPRGPGPRPRNRPSGRRPPLFVRSGRSRGSGALRAHDHAPASPATKVSLCPCRCRQDVVGKASASSRSPSGERNITWPQGSDARRQGTPPSTFAPSRQAADTAWAEPSAMRPGPDGRRERPWRRGQLLRWLRRADSESPTPLGAGKPSERPTRSALGMITPHRCHQKRQPSSPNQQAEGACTFS